MKYYYECSSLNEKLEIIKILGDLSILNPLFENEETLFIVFDPGTDVVINGWHTSPKGSIRIGRNGLLMRIKLYYL